MPLWRQEEILEGYPDAPSNLGLPHQSRACYNRREIDDLEELDPTPSRMLPALPKNINSLQPKGWVEGYEERQFKPDQPITRPNRNLVNRILEARSTRTAYCQRRAVPDSTKCLYYRNAGGLNSILYERQEDGYEIWSSHLPEIEM